MSRHDTVGRSLRAVLGVDFDPDASASDVFDDEFVEAGLDEAVLRVVVSSERPGARLRLKAKPPTKFISIASDEDKDQIEILDDFGEDSDVEDLLRDQEPALKGAQKSYRNQGKKEKQAAAFPELQAEIESKRKDLYKPYRWPDTASRKRPDFIEELRKLSEGRIGGTPEEQRVFFDSVVAKYPQCFWTEGCAPPAVRGHLIRFRLKPGAKPVARQPIPLSPFDDLRVEYHIEENVAQGKLRKIDTAKDQLPEWSTPVFVVDQDAKGLLGRMVCAYGPVNKELEISTFPSADPARAFDIAAFKSHHSVVDAIWGYTQFLLDEPTRKMLVICSRSGLYEWTRMPFGPAPAPAEMQSYVARSFGALRDRDGKEFCSPCMDDLKVSSKTLKEHIEHMEILCQRAASKGFEFKMKKDNSTNMRSRSGVVSATAKVAGHSPRR